MTDFCGGFRFQVSNITEFLRYKEFYTTLRSDIGIGLRPRVLVFGCSSGEEIKTVYHFWPDAEVFACDIQEDMITIARDLFPSTHFFPSTKSGIMNNGTFDFICANSVFCRHPFPDRPMAELIPFEIFDEYVSLLVDRLNKNGILMIYNSNYFVQDTSCFRDLSCLNISRSWTGAFIPRLTSEGAICAWPNVTDGVITSYDIMEEHVPSNLTRLSCALFRKGRYGNSPTLWVNAGAQSIESPPILDHRNFPMVRDFRAVYRPYFHETPFFVKDTRHVAIETFVTDFLEGRWKLHGITYEVRP